MANANVTIEGNWDEIEEMIKLLREMGKARRVLGEKALEEKKNG